MIPRAEQLCEIYLKERAAEGRQPVTSYTKWDRDAYIERVGGPEEAAALDPLAPDIDLSPLYALMADPKVLKVFHASRQDVEIFYHSTGAVPTPLFDTHPIDYKPTDTKPVEPKPLDQQGAGKKTRRILSCRRGTLHLAAVSLCRPSGALRILSR